MDRFIALACVFAAIALVALPLGGCIVIPVGDPDDDRGADADDDVDDGEDDTTRCADLGGIEITFDGAANVRACFDTWNEEGVPLAIDGTPQCNNGTCGAADGSWDPGSVWTFGSAILGDLSQLDCEVTEVEVELSDYVGLGAATLDLYDADGGLIDTTANTTVGQQETLVAGAGEDFPVSTLALGGCETAFHTIRLY